MSEETKGLVFDIERYAIHDGPGIRTVVFLKGCPVRCLWCANPESQGISPEISFRESECIACGHCEKACPEGAIRMAGEHPLLDRSACTACGKCSDACPSGALERIGREFTTSELYQEIASDRIFWERSGGGVTLSGGEPLSQARFSSAFLKECKHRHVHTAVETCLHTPRHVLETVLPFVDSFLCDLKILDDEQHRLYTGVSNKLLQENLAFLLESPLEVLVRMPFIPGVNSHRENLSNLAAYLNQHRLGAKVELLPYHRLGVDKYARLGRQYPLPEILPPCREDMAEATAFLAGLGLKVVRT